MYISTTRRSQPMTTGYVCSVCGLKLGFSLGVPTPPVSNGELVRGTRPGPGPAPDPDSAPTTGPPTPHADGPSASGPSTGTIRAAGRRSRLDALRMTTNSAERRRRPACRHTLAWDGSPRLPGPSTPPSRTLPTSAWHSSKPGLRQDRQPARTHAAANCTSASTHTRTGHIEHTAASDGPGVSPASWVRAPNARRVTTPRGLTENDPPPPPRPATHPARRTPHAAT